MIGLYCPELPPIPGGVADHTMALARALERRATPVAVLGRRGGAERFSPIPVKLDITPRSLPKALRELDIRGLMVQYVPFLYARFGVAPALAPAIEQLRAGGTRIALFVHEPFVPFTRLPWLVTGFPQRRQLRRLVRTADRVYTAVPRFADICRRYARDPQAVQLAPVGATIPVSPLARREARARLGLDEATVAIGVFSPAAAAYRADWVRAAMQQLAGRRDVAWLVFGHGSGTLFPEAPANVRRLGELDAGAVGATARALDLLVAPYGDGLTMRRTGAMLALSHGVALLSSTGPLFDETLLRYAACEPGLPAFQARLAELIDQPASRAALAERAAASAPASSIDTLAALVARDLAA